MRARKPPYATRRRQLIQRICPAKRCHHCGSLAPSWKALEIDHLDGKGWVSRKVNSTQRLAIMEREVDAGARLVGSCGHCNHSSGATRKYKWNVKRRRDRGGRGYTSYALEYAHYMAQQARREADEQEREQQAARDQDGRGPGEGDPPF